MVAIGLPSVLCPAPGRGERRAYPSSPRHGGSGISPAGLRHKFLALPIHGVIYRPSL